MTKRYEDLAKRGIAPREQVDTSRADMAALNATVSADKAAVENAKVQLEYATINAPISGRTGALMVHEGNLVRANDQTALVTINQIMPMSVSFSVPESRLPELKRYLAGGALTRHGDTAQRRGSRRHWQDRLRRQRGRREQRHDPRQRHVPQHGSPALARPVRQRRRHAHDGSEGDRGAVGCGADRSAGHVRVRGQAGPDRRDASRHRRRASAQARRCS